MCGDVSIIVISGDNSITRTTPRIYRTKLTVTDWHFVGAKPGILREILQKAGAGTVLVTPIVVIATPATRPPPCNVRAATVTSELSP